MKKKNPAAVALGRLGGSKPTTKLKGFAAMDPERRRLIAAQGGKASQSQRAQERETKKGKRGRPRKQQAQ